MERAWTQGNNAKATHEYQSDPVTSGIREETVPEDVFRKFGLANAPLPMQGSVVLLSSTTAVWIELWHSDDRGGK